MDTNQIAHALESIERNRYVPVANTDPPREDVSTEEGEHEGELFDRHAEAPSHNGVTFNNNNVSTFPNLNFNTGITQYITEEL